MKKYVKYIALGGCALLLFNMYRNGEIKLLPDKEQGAELVESVMPSTGFVRDITSDIKDTFLDTASPSKEEALQKATLIRVVDGDTIIILNENDENEYIRLIGIDTPESVHPDDERNTEYGNIASNYTKSLLSGTTTVFLQYDEERTDQYGRTLAYVWLSPGADLTSRQDIASFMLNGILIRNGYAIDRTYPPNIKYADIFAELRQEAEATKAGFWLINGFGDSGN